VCGSQRRASQRWEAGSAAHGRIRCASDRCADIAVWSGWRWVELGVIELEGGCRAEAGIRWEPGSNAGTAIPGFCNQRRRGISKYPVFEQHALCCTIGPRCQLCCE